MAAIRSCCRCSIFRRSWTALCKSRALPYHDVQQYSTEPLPSPTASTEKYPEHIESLVERISKLNLLEVSRLNELLKTRLNIQDTPMMMAGTVAAAPVDEPSGEEAAAEEQAEFAVKLIKFDDAKKVKLIKEIKSIMTDINLVQAKKFVESVPQIVKEKLSKEDADKLKTQLEAVGATLEVE
ncbi:39S ribosomal protein L12, mitochondrial-like [Hydractinia symbiolongicarpus]|uniref:39S ribosomal protein L12, mitochondrial-like n=1 Tax=Hydractinia symbiolongicarpus TaxID=13093 RepID=UPI00254FD2FB|nr:39S ribosomal protein L12, mitochondrial-like [Hydractinia symbiolongicarpus]